MFLAEAAGGEILNFDSVQVYRGFDIGSAKVPPSDRRGIPHHLIDLIGADEELSAGSFARIARQTIADVTSRGALPLLVGGTGFYLRAILEGLSPAPGRNDSLRARLTRVGQRRPGVLHRFLRRRDLAAAQRIHPNDAQKLIRAIELTVVTGRPATETQSLPRESLQGYTVLKLGLSPDRAELYQRLDRRTAQMFNGGLLEEAQALLQSGAAETAKPLQSLGYKQALAALDGSLSLGGAIRECQTKTRQYAKRQMTWFRREHDVHWLNGFGGDEVIRQEAVRLLLQWRQS